MCFLKKKGKIRDKIRKYSGFSREFRKRSGSESNRFPFRFRDQPFRFRPVSVFSRKSENDRKNIENGTGIFPYFPVPFSSLPEGEFRWQNCLRAIHQEERRLPGSSAGCGLDGPQYRRELLDPLPGPRMEPVESPRLEAVEYDGVCTLDLTIALGVRRRC